MGRGDEKLVRIGMDELKRLQKMDHEIGVLRMVNSELKDSLKKVTSAQGKLGEAVDEYRRVVQQEHQKIVDLFEQERVLKAHQEPKGSPPAAAKRPR